jgi:hypothetical protein
LIPVLAKSLELLQKPEIVRYIPMVEIVLFPLTVHRTPLHLGFLIKKIDPSGIVDDDPPETERSTDDEFIERFVGVCDDFNSDLERAFQRIQEKEADEREEEEEYY